MPPEDDDTEQAPRRGWRARPTGLALTVAGLVYGALVATLLAGDLRLADGHWFALLLAAGWGAWALALLLDRPPFSPEKPRGLLASAVLWFAIFAILGAAHEAVDPPPDLVGFNERLLLAPLALLALLGLAHVLRLRRELTAFALLLVAAGSVAPFAGGTDDWPAELVAAAGPQELRQAMASGGETVALYATRHDRGAPVAPAPRKPGMQCERLTVRDQRRTLVGSPARRLKAVGDVCWLADGTPFSVRLVASANSGDAATEVHAVQVVGTDPFSTDESGPQLVAPARTTTKNDAGSYAVKPFDARGRVRLGGIGGPALVDVSQGGRDLTLVIGWLGSGAAARSNTDSGVLLDDPRVVELGDFPRGNQFLDVLQMNFAYRGGPYARLTRYRQRGAQPIFLGGAGTTEQDTADDGTREVVTAVGGR